MVIFSESVDLHEKHGEGKVFSLEYVVSAEVQDCNWKADHQTAVCELRRCL